MTRLLRLATSILLSVKTLARIFAPRNFGRVVRFNVGGWGYNGSIKKGKRMKTICVFCMEVYSADAYACYPCKEYKGIMPLNKETLIYLGEDLEEWADYLD